MLSISVFAGKLKYCNLNCCLVLFCKRPMFVRLLGVFLCVFNMNAAVEFSTDITIIFAGFDAARDICLTEIELLPQERYKSRTEEGWVWIWSKLGYFLWIDDAIALLFRLINRKIDEAIGRIKQQFYYISAPLIWSSLSLASCIRKSVALQRRV